MTFDPTKSGKQFAHQMVLDGRPFSPTGIDEAEKDAFQIFTELSQATPQQKDQFQRAACEEMTDSNWKRKLLLDGGINQGKFLKEHYFSMPDCNIPQVREEMILNMLDHRLAKDLPIGIFRGPRLDRLRALYLTRKEQEPETWRYEWNGRIPDMRSRAVRGLPLITIPLLIKFPIISFFIAGFGFASGKNKIQESKVDIQKAESERSKNEAIEEYESGKTEVVLSAISLIAGFLRVLKITSAAAPAQEAETPLAKVLPFNPAERTTPLPPPPEDPGEDIVSLVAARAARNPTSPTTLVRGNKNPSFSPSANPSHPPANSPTSLNTPLLVSQKSEVSGQAAGMSMSATSEAANQMGEGVLVCIVGNTQRLVALKPQVVETIPIKPLSTPGDLFDGIIQSFQKFLVFLDREGNLVSHASILSDSLQCLAPSILSPLAVRMSSGSEPGRSNRSERRSEEDLLAEIETAKEMRKSKRRMMQLTVDELNRHLEIKVTLEEFISGELEQVFPLPDANEEMIKACITNLTYDRSSFIENEKKIKSLEEEIQKRKKFREFLPQLYSSSFFNSSIRVDDFEYREGYFQFSHPTSNDNGLIRVYVDVPQAGFMYALSFAVSLAVQSDPSRRVKGVIGNNSQVNVYDNAAYEYAMSLSRLYPQTSRSLPPPIATYTWEVTERGLVQIIKIKDLSGRVVGTIIAPMNRE